MVSDIPIGEEQFKRNDIASAAKGIDSTEVTDVHSQRGKGSRALSIAHDVRLGLGSDQAQADRITEETNRLNNFSRLSVGKP